MDIVSFLQQNKFGSLPYEVQLDRPIPQLNIEVGGLRSDKSYKRQFNNNMYTKTEWMCGCAMKNAFYCFPYLLFGDDQL